ncbi:MAG: ribonuclease HII [Chitinophagia bacterium]|nr:ribonuclease HII [Chitinophagia bacterium]
MPLKRYTPNDILECGCDEAGRGCMAGPVFAAAVILPPDYFHPLLNDSKQVAEHNRERLREDIESKALAYAVAQIAPEEIDAINILQATFKAMHLAIDLLTTPPQHLLIDGPAFRPYPWIPHSCHIGGDATYTAIAAASILAKTHRDQYMKSLHFQYPQYDWQNNKGYGTASHTLAIKKWGITPHHRKTFGICKDYFHLAM